MDMEPVAMEDLACASSDALRPSQPTGASPACPMPVSGCDLREVSLPESLRLRASVTPQPSSGKWQLAHAVLPEAEICGAKNRSRPRSTSAWFSIGRGGGRRDSFFIAVISGSGAVTWACAVARLLIAIRQMDASGLQTTNGIANCMTPPFGCIWECGDAE